MSEFGIDSIREGAEGQAQILAHKLASSFKTGAAGTIVFSWTDEWFTGGFAIQDWAFGLVDCERQQKPAFYSVQEYYKSLLPPKLSEYPKVSVVVCTYNAARTLDSCLASLERLNYPNYEVIVVNDGSTDGSLEIAQRYDYIRLISQKNKGLSVARNVGIAAAEGEIKEKGPVVNGVAYTGKSSEFERYMDLPSHSPLPLELALSGPAPIERLQEYGWLVRDGYEVSHNPWIYRDYLAHSFGEWSIAKNAYVASQSGWFSCRTASYLALGVPVILQDTGFSKTIPTGEGLLTFTTPTEAAEAIDRLKTNPQRHAQAAREIAQAYFDSNKVLTNLLEKAGSAK